MIPSRAHNGLQVLEFPLGISSQVRLVNQRSLVLAVLKSMLAVKSNSENVRNVPQRSLLIAGSRSTFSDMSS